MERPILYSYYRSSSAYRVRIALNLKKIDYKYHSVHLVKDGGEQFLDQFTEMNPKSEVPVFCHKENVFTQSMAILQYIDETFSGVSLFPHELIKKIRCIELCEMINSGIQPIQNVRVLRELETRYKVSAEEKVNWCHKWIHEGLWALEKKLQNFEGPYCLGKFLSAVDLFLIPQVYNAERFKVDLSQMKRINEVLKACLIKEEFIMAHPQNQPDCPDN